MDKRLLQLKDRLTDLESIQDFWEAIKESGSDEIRVQSITVFYDYGDEESIEFSFSEENSVQSLDARISSICETEINTLKSIINAELK